MLFIQGLIIIFIGIGIIKYRYQIYEFSGDWDWATKYLGGNGTVVAIVFIGMILIGFGTAYPFGGFKDIGFHTDLQKIEVPKK